MDSQPTVGDHISVSRIKRYVQCPKAYELHYIEKRPSTPGEPLIFGKLLHSPLERVYREVVSDRIVGRFPVERLVDAFRHEFVLAGLTDFGMFDEGLRLLKDYAAEHPIVDYRNILGIELEFRLPVDRFEVLGYIDRVDRIDDETVEIIDYKSNRMLFSREEVEHDLQLSVYELAVRALLPWVKRVRQTFYMLRHAVRLETSRTKEQLAAAREYVAAIAHQMETASEFPARLNTNCAYCDHNADCPEYARALRGEVKAGEVNEHDLESVSRSRQELAHSIKVLNARKDELDDILKAQLEERDALVLAGVRYAMFDVTKLSFPLRRTIDLVSSATGLPKPEVANSIAVIDKSALDELVKRVGKQIPRDRVAMLKAELEAVGERSVSQRLWAKELN
jgi:putative RecB family exonuclease